MSNGRRTGDKDKKAGPMGRLTPAQENELDSYNKFVEKIADQLVTTPSGLGRIPSQIFTQRSRPPIDGPAPGKRFKRPTKKPVFKTGTKEKVKGLTQDMADGGEVFNMSTEMVIDE